VSVLPDRRALRAAPRARRLGGPAGNEILTVTTAGLLTLLLIAEGLTLLNVGGLLTPHMVIGLVLIPPLLVKIASTSYRMVRYYTGHPGYRAKGPPPLPLRLLAPVLVAATIGIFGSGVALMAHGHRSDLLLTVHQASVIVWSAVFAGHFLSYLPRLLTSLRTDWRAARRDQVPGSELRAMLVAGSLGAGIALALVLLPLVTGWQGEH
jgi:hypothetical protein